MPCSFQFSFTTKLTNSPFVATGNHCLFATSIRTIQNANALSQHGYGANS